METLNGIREKSSPQDRVCVVGDFRFKVRSANVDLVMQTVDAFRADRDQLSFCDVIDLDTRNEFEGQPEQTDEPVSAIKRVLSVAEAAHHEHLYFDACCMTTSEGRTVFLAGQSFSGKSTVSAAAMFALNWKVVSEDVVFLDRHRDRVIGLVCPISLRPTAALLIKESTGQQVEPIRHGRWLTCYERFEQVAKLPARFDLSICFEGRAGAGDFRAEKISSTTFLHKLIGYGNWLTVPGGPEFVYRCFQESNFWCISGGTVAERLDWLSQPAHWQRQSVQ